MSEKFLVVIDNILSREECDTVIKMAESQKLEYIDRGNANYYRTIFINKEWADNLYRKLYNYIPKIYNGMQIVGLNDHFRFSKYEPGGRFEVHKDNINQDSQGNRSIFTLNIFLNSNFNGGETDFLFDDMRTLRLSAIPKTGRGALFDSQQFHRGNAVSNGYKYLLRTDVMVR